MMKSQNIVLILLISLFSSSFCTEQIIVGGYSQYRIPTNIKRKTLNNALQGINKTEIAFLQIK